jgi:magnesium chelatase family protein
MTPQEALDVSIIHSISGNLPSSGLLRERPFRAPHHTASQPALIGGGQKAKPGEISLAHNGVLFLDELPEFNRSTLEALRQPMENGDVLVARANSHVRYPARFQLVSAMNPCRCGHLSHAELECKKAPLCAQDYQSKISGPIMDRIDMQIEVPAVSITDLSLKNEGESSGKIAERVLKTRQIQEERAAHYAQNNSSAQQAAHLNAHAQGTYLETIAPLDTQARTLLNKAAERFHLSARAYFRIVRVARTIADLETTRGQTPAKEVSSTHMAEALSYRARHTT